MDPLTAISLASNVVGFVQFASELVRSTREIYGSANGCAADIVSLDQVYGRLRSLSVDLESEQFGKSTAHNAGSVEIHSLAALCKTDCDSLLEITRKLKSSSTSTSKWRSFRIALGTAWKQKAINELEQRLNNTQITITLVICTSMSKLHSNHSHAHLILQRRSEQLQADQRTGLQRILSSLASLEAKLEYASGQHNRPFTIDEIRQVEQQFSQMSLSESQMLKEQTMIKSLTFECLPLRYEAITEAHRRTFKWALDAESQGPEVRDRPVQSCALEEWLRNGEGVFWVSGKPGSGKSTLMKYISDEPRTFELLSQWAFPKTAVTVSHYFWNGGTPMQRSLHGLLRTLLYEIVRKCPSIIPIVCPDEWADQVSTSWDISALRKSFDRFAENCVDIDLKFCFFIDGLDEHDGDHLELCEILNCLSKSPNVKICLSSRPWNVFDEAFGHGTSKLYVHELTKGDIRTYAESRLHGHPKWESLITNKEDGQWLIEQITERAWGVFLWAVLVTKLLLEGLTNRDRFSDIRRRLDSFPIELEPFFQKIITSVDPFYNSKTATTLLIAMSAAKPLHFLFYEFHDQEYDNKEYALHMPSCPLTKEELGSIRESTAARLEGRTRGLLEIPAQGHAVTFLHRTVVDFLNKEEVKKYLHDQVASDLDFCVQLSLLKASLAYIKGIKGRGKVVRIGFGKYNFLDEVSVEMDGDVPEYNDANGAVQATLHDITHTALTYGARVDTEDRSSWNKEVAKTFDEMERVLARFMVENVWHADAYFREQLVICRVFNHLERKVTEDPAYVQNLGSNLFVYLLEPSLLEPGFIDPEKTTLHGGKVAMGRNARLFQQGLRIVQRAVDGRCIDLSRVDDDDDTAWSNLLVFIDRLDSPYRQVVLVQLLENDLFLTLLQQGADPNASLKDRYVMCEVAWELFLSWSVDISPVETARAAYLRTLRGFLAPDVDLASSAWTSTVGRLDFARMKPDTQFEARDGRPNPFDPSFLCSIASMLVRKLENSATLVQDIQDAVQAVLGSDFNDSLSTEHPDLIPMNKRKRAWEETKTRGEVAGPGQESKPRKKARGRRSTRK